MRLSGSCLCGQLRYVADAETPMAAVCHCSNCQKQTGSAFSWLVIVPSAQLRHSGTLKTYLDRGDSGSVVRRQFCPDCGSPLFSEMDSAPGITAIKAGTLDDGSALTPVMHVWCDSAQPWSSIPSDMPRFAQQPPAA